jgi:peptidoglycan/LPS O-acetylase OafA/YrhL
MGLVRTLLAFAVVFDHAGAFGVIPPHTPVYGLAPVTAVLAVQVFFVISGFYMSLVLTEKYRAHDGWVWRFWLSRYMRLWPSYAVVLLVTGIVWSNNIVGPAVPWGSWQHDLFKLSGLSLIGIDLTAFYTVGADYPAHGQLPVAQAWSLGAELWFYLLVPALAVLRTRWLVLLGAVLLAARLAIIGTLPEFPWQQRFFPLELWFFVLGMLAHRAYAKGIAIPHLGWPALAAAITLVLFIHHSDTLGGWTPRNALILTGALAVLLPFVFALSRNWKLDRVVGELSYPVYLVHVTVLAALPLARNHIALSVLLTLAAALPLLFLIDRPVDRLRARLTERTQVTSQAIA